MYNGAGRNLTSWSGEAANSIYLCQITIPFAITVSNLVVSSNADATNLYDFGIYDTTGALICSTGPYGLAGSPATPRALIGSPITIPAGNYLFAFTCNAASGTGIYLARDSAGAGIPGYAFLCAGTNSTGGTLPPIVAPGSLNWTQNYAYQPVVALY
jgi:hypothetical protein